MGQNLLELFYGQGKKTHVVYCLYKHTMCDMFTRRKSDANLEVVVMPLASIAAQYNTKDPEHSTDSSGSKISGMSSQDSAAVASETVTFVNRTLPVLETLRDQNREDRRKRDTLRRSSGKIHARRTKE